MKKILYAFGNAIDSRRYAQQSKNDRRAKFDGAKAWDLFAHIFARLLTLAIGCNLCRGVVCCWSLLLGKIYTRPQFIPPTAQLER